MKGKFKLTENSAEDHDDCVHGSPASGELRSPSEKRPAFKVDLPRMERAAQPERIQGEGHQVGAL